MLAKDALGQDIFSSIYNYFSVVGPFPLIIV